MQDVWYNNFIFIFKIAKKKLPLNAPLKKDCRDRAIAFGLVAQWRWNGIYLNQWLNSVLIKPIDLPILIKTVRSKVYRWMVFLCCLPKKKVRCTRLRWSSIVPMATEQGTLTYNELLILADPCLLTHRRICLPGKRLGLVQVWRASKDSVPDIPLSKAA